MTTKKYLTGFILITSIVLGSCGKINTRNFTSRLSWLEGHWEMKTPHVTLTEVWKKTATGFRADGYMLSGKDTVFSELLKIKAIDGNIYFGATVFNQNNNKEVDFLMINNDADSIVFENQYHDYPTRISYIKKGDKEMIARASGTVQGKQKEDVFYFTRKP